MAPLLSDSDFSYSRCGATKGMTTLIILMSVLGFALTIIVFQPGFATTDAEYVYQDSQSWNFGDWQSPVIELVWWLIDPIAPGMLSMLLLTASLYWLAFGLLALVAARRSIVVGFITPFVALAPPAFMLLGMIWRDILFGVTWLFAAVLVFAVANRRTYRLPVQGAALSLIALGVLFRPNSLIAAPVLAAYVVWPARFEFKRLLLIFLPAALAFYALIPLVYYGLLHSKRQNLIQTIMVYDLAAISYFTKENQFPVQWTAQQTNLLTTSCYNPAFWDAYFSFSTCSFVMERLGDEQDRIFGTDRLRETWQRAILTHPLAYLHHRLLFTWNFLALSNQVLPEIDWSGADSPYRDNAFFQAFLSLHNALEKTIVYRPGFWLMIALVMTICAWRMQKTADDAFIVGIAGCACVYVLTFAAVGVASDFRYVYWCVLAVIAAALVSAARLLEPKEGRVR